MLFLTMNQKYSKINTNMLHLVADPDQAFGGAVK